MTNDDTVWKITENLEDFNTPENDHGPPPKKDTFFQGTSSSIHLHFSGFQPAINCPAACIELQEPVWTTMDVSQGMMRALTQEQKDEVLKHDECQKESLFSGPILGGSS